jgi:UPF0755 protein
MAEARLRRRLGWLLALGLLVAGLTAGGFAWLAQDYVAPGPAEHTVRVRVSAGDSLGSVFARLHALGALAHPRAVALYLRLQREQPRMEIGVYDIPAASSPAQIVRMFEAGKVVLDKLTIVEGATFEQFVSQLDADPDIVPTLRGKSAAAIMAALGHPGEQPEGRFFPDTYRFSPGTTDLTLLAIAYRQMRSELERAWRGRSAGLPLANAYQALILASLIEKETGVADERARIAGVFVNRLRRGMRLQSDPTVIFALGARYHGALHASDLAIASPYNTYLHAGLPPTPICLPGEASLQAAVHPDRTKDLYFVATGKGGHHFSRTLAEHDIQLRHYIRQLRRDRKADPTPRRPQR